MALKHPHYRIVSLIGSAPLTSFDALDALDPRSQSEQTRQTWLRRAMSKFGPASFTPWLAAVESVNVVMRRLGLDRLMVYQETTRPVQRQALDNLLTQELMPHRAQQPAHEINPLANEVQRLRGLRS